jgi:hypothetical protein
MLVYCNSVDYLIGRLIVVLVWCQIDMTLQQVLVAFFIISLLRQLLLFKRWRVLLRKFQAHCLGYAHAFYVVVGDLTSILHFGWLCLSPVAVHLVLIES